MNGVLTGDIETNCHSDTAEEIRKIALDELLLRKSSVDDYLLSYCAKYLSGYKLRKLMLDVEQTFEKGAIKLKAIVAVHHSEDRPLPWQEYCPAFTNEINKVLRFASFDMRLHGISAAGVYIPLDFVSFPYTTAEVNGFHQYVQANIDEQYNHASRLLGEKHRVSFKAIVTDNQKKIKEVDLSDRVKLKAFQKSFNEIFGTIFSEMRRVSFQFSFF